MLITKGMLPAWESRFSSSKGFPKTSKTLVPVGILEVTSSDDFAPFNPNIRAPERFGGLSIINTHLKSGATIVLTNKSVVENLFWDLFKKYKVTSFGGVPFQYDIIEKIFKHGVPRSLKYSTQAGGKMNETLIKNLIKIYSDSRKKFIQMYGAAEATSRMSYLKWEDAPKKNR